VRTYIVLHYSILTGAWYPLASGNTKKEALEFIQALVDAGDTPEYFRLVADLSFSVRRRDKTVVSHKKGSWKV
jgi:hypothetical protein